MRELVHFTNKFPTIILLQDKYFSYAICSIRILEKIINCFDILGKRRLYVSLFLDFLIGLFLLMNYIF